MTALIQNATHSIGRSFSSGDSGKCRSKSENPKVQRDDDADEDRHSVGVKEENRRKREQ